jgi:hypothetical protein
MCIATIGGCATNKVPVDLSPELKDEYEKPLHCFDADECKLMWDRATFFVNTNAGFKIQIHNDNLIQTYNPSQYSPALAFSISKEPLGDGSYRIWTKSWCDNAFGCKPNQIEAIARAKRYMRTGVK